MSTHVVIPGAGFGGLETRFPDVYVVGDITSAPVPRAVLIAEGEAATVADVLIARITGGQPPAPSPGEMTCYIEMGEDTVGTVDANFAFRRDRWFGPGPGASLPDGTTPDSASTTRGKS